MENTRRCLDSVSYYMKGFSSIPQRLESFNVPERQVSAFLDQVYTSLRAISALVELAALGEQLLRLAYLPRENIQHQVLPSHESNLTRAICLENSATVGNRKESIEVSR